LKRRVKMKHESRKEFTLGKLGIFVALLTAVSFFGCPVLIPVAVHYYKDSQGYVATAEVDAEASTVYNAAVREAEARAPKIRIIKKEEDDFLLEITDGVQEAIIKVESTDSGKTELIVRADVPEDAEGKKEEKIEEELALRAIKTICDSLGVKYEIVEKQ
jgi:hypothetical protein